MTLRAKKPLRYMSRMLQVGDEFEPMAGDVRYLTARGRAEVVTDEPRRGRKTAAEPKAESDPTLVQSEVPEPTHAELMERAEKLGIELPSGYVRKDVLLDLIDEAEKAEGDDA